MRLISMLLGAIDRFMGIKTYGFRSQDGTVQTARIRVELFGPGYKATYRGYSCTSRSEQLAAYNCFVGANAMRTMNVWKSH